MKYEGKWLRCHRCSYEWKYVGARKYVSCPKCNTMVAMHLRQIEKDDELKLSDFDIGYLAGVIDGDGSLSFGFLVRRTKTMGERPRVNVECTISNTDERLHRRIMDMLKGCNVKQYWDDRSRKGYKDMGHIKFYANEARRILPLIRPVSAKRDQIDILLKVLKFTELSKIYRGLTDDDIDWLCGMQQRLIELHGLQAKKLLRTNIKRYKVGIKGEEKIRMAEEWFANNVKDVEPTEEMLIGWLNGIVDTDGYFVWNWNKHHVRSFRLEVENTNYAIIEQLARTYDVLGVQYHVVDKKIRNGRDKKVIAVANNQIRELMPYLDGLCIKRDEMEIIRRAMDGDGDLAELYKEFRQTGVRRMT